MNFSKKIPLIDFLHLYPILVHRRTCQIYCQVKVIESTRFLVKLEVTDTKVISVHKKVSGSGIKLIELIGNFLSPIVT